MPLQQHHMKCFQEAYGASHTRPKAQYALHLPAQMQRWQRHIDCYVGERKHRLFKRYVGPKISKLEGYAKSVLLHLTDMELSNPEPKERWTAKCSVFYVKTQRQPTELACPSRHCLQQASRSDVLNLRAAPTCASLKLLRLKCMAALLLRSLFFAGATTPLA